MSQPSRSILKMIITNFVNSLKPRRIRGDLAGKDHLGNKYYQIPGSSRQKVQRWFDPKEKDNFEQEIPAEWESWLRYRRKDAPTEDEVLANASLAEQKKINAAKLDNSKTPQLEENAGKHIGPTSFPSYNEYEIFPGTSQDKAKKNK